MSEFIVGLLNEATVNEPDRKISYLVAEVCPVVRVWGGFYIEEHDRILYVCVNEAQVEQDVPENDRWSELPVVLGCLHRVCHRVETVKENVVS